MLYASTVQAQKSYKSLERRQLRLGSKVSKAPNSVLKGKGPGAKKIVKHRNGALEKGWDSAAARAAASPALTIFVFGSLRASTYKSQAQRTTQKCTDERRKDIP